MHLLIEINVVMLFSSRDAYIFGQDHIYWQCKSQALCKVSSSTS